GQPLARHPDHPPRLQERRGPRRRVGVVGDERPRILDEGEQLARVEGDEAGTEGGFDFGEVVGGGHPSFPFSFRLSRQRPHTPGPAQAARTPPSAPAPADSTAGGPAPPTVAPTYQPAAPSRRAAPQMTSP